MNTGIYQILHIESGKKYVGSAVQLEKRFKEHRNALVGGYHHNRLLQRAWNKHGAETFQFSVLLFCDKENLLFYEQRVMNKYGSHRSSKGYNLSPTAGNSLGVKHSEETKLRMGQASTGRPAWNKGIPCTEKQKQILSRANKGRKHSEEARLKISKGLIGRPVSEETRKKVSASNTGKRHSEEIRLKIIKNHVSWNRGKKLAPDHLQKILESRKQNRLLRESSQNENMAIQN